VTGEYEKTFGNEYSYAIRDCKAGINFKAMVSRPHRNATVRRRVKRQRQ
jgi:hypothetical protein